MKKMAAARVIRAIRLWWAAAVCAGLAAVPVVAGEALPELIVLDDLGQLYQPVQFAHELHWEITSCNSCHHFGGGEDEADPDCAICHGVGRAERGMRCLDCHPRKTRVVDLDPARRSGPGASGAGSVGRVHLDTVGLKGAYHLLCLGCHRREGAPSACTDCHLMNEAGRDRFRLAEDPAEPSTPIKDAAME